MPDARPESSPRPTRFWRGVVAAACVGLLLRLAFGLIYWTDKPLTRDEREYLSLSRGLSDGRGFTYDDEARTGGIEPFSRAPAYPAFLALIGSGAAPVSSVPTTTKVVQAFIGAAGVLLIGLVARRIAGVRAAIIAAAIAAAYPPLVWISAYAMSEALFWPIVLLAAWLFDRTSTEPSRIGRGLLTGAVVGLGILVRSGLVLVLPLAALVLLARRQVSLGLILLVGVVIVVAPWTLRNYREHGRLIVVAADGGVTFWTGNHPMAIGEGDLAANPTLKFDDQRLRSQHVGLSAEALEPFYYREALAWIGEHPLDWAWLEVRKLFYLVVPIGPSYTLHSSRYYALTLASYLPLLVLAIVGAWRRQWTGPIPGLFLIAGSAIVGALIFFPQERFRIPIIDPTLIILAAAALAPANRSDQAS